MALRDTPRLRGDFEHEFSAIAAREVRIQFTAHLIPANRGILATGYVKGDAKAVHDALAAAYADEPFIEVLPFGEAPSTRHIRGSNFCHIGVSADRIAGRAIVVAALDNLTKGSSGQALQNANLMLGEEETTGLMLAPVFPQGTAREDGHEIAEETKTHSDYRSDHGGIGAGHGFGGICDARWDQFFPRAQPDCGRSAQPDRDLPHWRAGGRGHIGAR